MILLIKNFHFGNDILTTMNFQVHDLDLQAMGGGGDGTEKKLWTHTYHQTIYESDPSKGLEIIRCSNKVPKTVRKTLHVEGRTDLILVYRFTYIAIWAILWQLALVSSHKGINILHYPFLLSDHAAFQ